MAGYLDSGPVRRWRAAAPGRQPPPETPCASSSAPVVHKRINKAARKTEGPVRTGGFAAERVPLNLYKNPNPIWFRILKRLIGRARFLRDPRWRLLCVQNQIKHRIQNFTGRYDLGKVNIWMKSGSSVIWTRVPTYGTGIRRNEGVSTSWRRA